MRNHQPATRERAIVSSCFFGLPIGSGILVLMFSFGMTLAGCGVTQTDEQGHQENIGFIAFGDSGYNYKYLGKQPLTEDVYVEKQKVAWIESFKSPAEFKRLPLYQIPNTNLVVQASGAVPVAKAIVSHCATDRCSFGLMLGDNIYPKGATGTDSDAERFKIIFEDTYAELGRNVAGFKLFAALGNHDWRYSVAGKNAQLRYTKDPGTKIQMYGDGYYSFVKGDAQFFVLDTGLLLSGEVIYEAVLSPDGSVLPHERVSTRKRSYPRGNEKESQLDWFTQEISKSNAKWKIVYGHHNLWSAGGDKFEQARVLRDLVMPTICNYADMYLAGHEHDLEVHTDSCEVYLGNTNSPPLPLIVSGAGSKQRAVHRRFMRSQKEVYSQLESVWAIGMVWGFTHVTLANDAAVIKMITTPNSGSGIPVVESTFHFERRSHLLPKSNDGSNEG